MLSQPKNLIYHLGTRTRRLHGRTPKRDPTQFSPNAEILRPHRHTKEKLHIQNSGLTIKICGGGGGGFDFDGSNSMQPKIYILLLCSYNILDNQDNCNYN